MRSYRDDPKQWFWEHELTDDDVPEIKRQIEELAEEYGGLNHLPEKVTVYFPCEYSAHDIEFSVSVKDYYNGYRPM